MSFFHVDCTEKENIFQSLENVDSPQGAKSYLFFIIYFFFFFYASVQQNVACTADN